MAPKSDRPLLKVGSLTIVTTVAAPVSTYTELLKVGCDPNTELYIDSIAWEQDITTTNVLINIFLDGKPYVRDTPMLASAGSLGFGRDLVLTNPHKAILIQVKSTAAGTVRINAWVSGIEIMKFPK